MTVTGAVDLGGTKLAVGLVSAGQVLDRRSIPSAHVQDYRTALDTICALLRELARAAGEPLDGVGVGLTGRLDRPSGLVGRNDLFPDWQGRDLAGDLSALLGVGTAVENDADAAALAESAWGAGAGIERFIYLTVSTGIGGGIVLDGKLYRGVGGSHPEIGHHVIDPSGPACYCGARGCWERLASGRAMAEQAREHAGALAPERLDARGICDLAERGVDWAREAVAREGYYLGLGLANLVNLFAPDCIALGGGVMQRWGLFAAAARRVVQDSVRLVPAERVQIVPTRLGADTPLLGAARAWLSSRQ